MPRYAEGKSREQIQILSYDEMINKDNPVRVIDAFVDCLDMMEILWEFWGEFWGRFFLFVYGNFGDGSFCLFKFN